MTVINAPDTSTTELIYETLRRAILTYEGPSGESVSQPFGGEERVWVRAAPSPTVFPYIVLRLSRAPGGANGYRERCSLEVQVIGRPESQQPLVLALADLVDACFLGYAEPASGLSFSRERTRDTLPQFLEPADKTVVGELMRYSLFIWPLVSLNLRPNP